MVFVELPNSSVSFYHTLILEQNLYFFPKEVLLVVLTVCHPCHPPDHWVVTKMIISGINFFVMVYEWAQQGFIYIVLTCGKTVYHIKGYCSKFSNKYDNKETKAYPSPVIAYQNLLLLAPH